MASISPCAGDKRRGHEDHPTSVYRYYDSIGVLIYVGVTRQATGRNVQHNRGAEWWPFVARQEVEHLPSRSAALLFEKRLISAHRPPFNKQHNPDHAAMRAAYLAYAGAFSGQMRAPRELYERLDRRLPMDVLHWAPGELVLRSRLEHGPLATLLQKGSGEPVVRGRRRSYGHVVRLERVGPTVTVHCFLRSSKKVRQPEGGLAEADVLMGWTNNPHPGHPVIRQILATEGDLIAREAS